MAYILDKDIFYKEANVFNELNICGLTCQHCNNCNHKSENMEKIPQTIIDKVKENYILQNDINEIVDYIYKHPISFGDSIKRKNSYKRVKVFDETNLFGHTIEDVIKYLETFDKTNVIEQEDDYVYIASIQNETETEYIDRISSICLTVDNLISAQKYERKRLLDKKAELLKEIETIEYQLNS